MLRWIQSLLKRAWIRWRLFWHDDKPRIRKVLAFSCGGETWETCDVVTGVFVRQGGWFEWHNYHRIEIRYTIGPRKFRMLLHAPEELHWRDPRRGGASWGAGPTIIHAVMVPRHPQYLPKTVTPRICKYAGPRRDFHGTLPTNALYFFPKDDPEELADVYKELRVYDSLGRRFVLSF